MLIFYWLISSVKKSGLVKWGGGVEGDEVESINSLEGDNEFEVMTIFDWIRV
jgi:hypothetical protein